MTKELTSFISVRCTDPSRSACDHSGVLASPSMTVKETFFPGSRVSNSPSVPRDIGHC